MHANGEGQRQTTHGLASLVRRLWSLFRLPRFRKPTPAPEVTAASRELQPLRRVLLSEGVGRTLFEEYAEHRRGPRGAEETGWVLLGLRQRDEAIALATLPAGTRRDAGVAHVRFDSQAQVVGSRIVRQHDRRLTILGVVHTHPGGLRQPSDGDFEGDRLWVRNLRGGEGVFGIGTADAGKGNWQPRPNVESAGELMFSWYSLADGQSDYRPLPVERTEGPDLARPLHGVWGTLESQADRLERLHRQQAGLKFEVIAEESEPALAVTVPLAEPGDSLRVLLGPDGPRYLVRRGGDLFAVDPGARSIDQGVYLLLAELAARS